MIITFISLIVCNQQLPYSGSYSRSRVKPFVAGETFTAADVLYAGTFALFMDSPLLGENKTKALEDYVARCVSRPARARAAAKDQNPV
jgi:glutathione S-transferase